MGEAYEGLSSLLVLFLGGNIASTPCSWSPRVKGRRGGGFLP